MVSCSIADILPWLYGSRAEAFIGLNYHEFRVIFYQANGSALVWEEIVLDWAETESLFQCVAECPHESLQCEGDVPGRRFPFRPDVDLRVGKRYEPLTSGEDAANMQVSLEGLHDLVDVECGAERGGAEVNPESQH